MLVYRLIAFHQPRFHSSGRSDLKVGDRVLTKLDTAAGKSPRSKDDGMVKTDLKTEIASPRVLFRGNFKDHVVCDSVLQGRNS